MLQDFSTPVLLSDVTCFVEEADLNISVKAEPSFISFMKRCVIISVCPNYVGFDSFSYYLLSTWTVSARWGFLALQRLWPWSFRFLFCFSIALRQWGKNETWIGSFLLCSPAGDGTHNLSMCSDWKSKLQHLGPQDNAPASWATSARASTYFSILGIFETTGSFVWSFRSFPKYVLQEHGCWHRAGLDNICKAHFITLTV